MFQGRVEAKQTADEYPLFDWLRFILASVVALAHERVIGVPHLANLAVQIFFALSGWLIGGILLNTTNLPKFYYKRATRIWIPYALAVVFLYAVAAIHEGINATWWRSLFFDGTFTHNWFVYGAMPLDGTGNHFWSIAVEEQFYLAAPLLIVVLRIRSALAWSIIAATAVLSGSWYGSISLGVLAAVTRPKIDPVLLIVAALISIAGTFVDYQLFAPPLAISVVLLASKPGQRSPVGEFCGGVSYPLYLWHWTGAFAASWLGKRGLLVPAYPVAVMVGIGAYIAVDRNVMRLRSFYYSNRAGKALMITAYALLAAGVIYGCSDAM